MLTVAETVATNQRLEETTPPEALCERLLADIDDFSVMPVVAFEALELVKDPSCSIGSFVSIVERDLRLATDVLSMANSIMYAGSSPIDNLQQAVVRLGFRQCKNLIITASVNGMMQRLTLEQAWMREVIWRHSMLTAVACMHINKALNIGLQGEEYACGLVHDLGRMLLAIVAPDDFMLADTLDFDNEEGCLEHEMEVLGTNHCAMASWFLERSNMPYSLIESVRYHHDPSQASGDPRIVAIVCAGDQLANYIQRHNNGADYDAATNQGIQTLDRLGIPHVADRFDELASTIIDEVLVQAGEIFGTE